jgi:hypothetical protein
MSPLRPRSRYYVPNRIVAPKLKRQKEPIAEKAEETQFLKSVLSAFVLVTAWVFVIGWTYLRVYYVDFGINVDSLGFPVYRYFVFSFAQFVALQGYGPWIGILLILFFFATWVGMQTKSKPVALLVSCSYLLLFWVGFYMTVHDAKAEARRDMGRCSTRPMIQIEMPDKEKIKYHWAKWALTSNNLRLLIETDDQLFVFVPVDTETTKPTFPIKVLAIDRHAIVATTRIVCLARTNQRSQCKVGIPCSD